MTVTKTYKEVLLLFCNQSFNQVNNKQTLV